jgi:hypothetical protein
MKILSPITSHWRNAPETTKQPDVVDKVDVNHTLQGLETRGLRRPRHFIRSFSPGGAPPFNTALPIYLPENFAGV